MRGVSEINKGSISKVQKQRIFTFNQFWGVHHQRGDILRIAGPLSLHTHKEARQYTTSRGYSG